eukprot:2574833-Amphidinium_carterae.1
MQHPHKNVPMCLHVFLEWSDEVDVQTIRGTTRESAMLSCNPLCCNANRTLLHLRNVTFGVMLSSVLLTSSGFFQHLPGVLSD